MLIKSNPDEIQAYLVDASNFKGTCEKVFFPENELDVISILKDANDNNFNVTVSGNGTGLTGARVPIDGVVISIDKLNKILELNIDEKYIVIEPGVLLSVMNDEVKKVNLLYPPDPTEQNCYVGATIATNASGAKTFKYGPTRHFVLELDVILPTGKKVELKRGEFIAKENLLKIKTTESDVIEIVLPDYKMPTTKNASGYFIHNNMDAIDLFIGSEGTLGIITKAKLKLLDAPFNTLSCVVFFNSEKDGLSFISEGRVKSNSPDNLLSARALEFFDKNALDFLRDDFSEINGNFECAVWFEQEINADNEDELTELWFNQIEECNGDTDNIWVALQETDKARIKEFRHAISYKVNEYISRNNFRKLGTDVAVPDSDFNEFYFYCQSLVKSSGIDSVCYGHFGNSHIHLNMLPKNEEEFLIGKNLYKSICEKAVELNGTVSAEHGIGKIKLDYLKLMYGDDGIDKMKSIKKILDPNFILGRGTMFPAD